MEALTVPIAHPELLARISEDYYSNNKSKVHIAAAYNLSRFQVARYLEEAKALGIVRIEIHFPAAEPAIDTVALAEDLGISKVVLVSADAADELQRRDALAKAAARELSGAVAPGFVVGISWSRTLDLATRHLTSMTRCDFVQLAGALPASGAGNPLDLPVRLGKISGGRAWPIWAPLVVEDSATAESLIRQPELSEALARADNLDVAVIAIGAWKSGLSTVWDRVDVSTRRAGTLAGAVAEVSGRLINARGEAVHTELDDRIIAVTVEQLSNTPAVIAVAQGAARTEAVLAAVRAGIIDILILDPELALSLLEELPSRHTGGQDAETVGNQA